MSVVELLKSSLGAADVSQATIDEIASISETRTYDADEIIYRESDSSDYLCIVSSGMIEVQYLLPSGIRRTVDTLNPGDVLVWSALVQPYTTNSIGISRTKSEVLAIPGPKLRDICEKDTKLGYRLMSQIAQVIRRRLQAARLQIAEVE
mgnify:CR=1 FL=1